MSSRLIVLLAILGIAGCRSEMMRSCVPMQTALSPRIDLTAGEADPMVGDPNIISAIKRRPNLGPLPPTDEAHRPLNVLAMSGGGIYGAFDVGVLAGWNAAGTRPVFDVVTGISTGALIATFAFLGPQYDSFLQDAYVNTTSQEIYQRRRLLAILRSDSVASSVPLQRKIMEAITPEVLAEVAREHAAGRRLYIGTTNLDTRRLVIWDMGAIAASRSPDALRLYQKIVLASASVPGFFPPVYFDVEFDGKRYQEIHVDGGATAAVFVRPYMLRLRAEEPQARVGSKLFVISSGKLFADPECVEPTLRRISSSAISTLLYAGSRGDIYRIHDLALATGSEFKLIAVPQEFPLDPNSLYVDRAQMRRLYDVGYQMGVTGQGWLDAPPDLDGGDLGPPRAGVRFAITP
jgi:predicted acylesterase/phospholipase RssA